MTLDINAIYNAGIASLGAEHDVKEAEKLGILRAGNTGAIISGNKVIGECARKTLLRYDGIKYEAIEDSKKLMFDAGLSNEDIWTKSLEAGFKAQGLNLVIKREEEIPIRWETPSGIPVSGRPDIVVGTLLPTSEGQEFKPILGLELKLVSSTWTARDTGIMLEPKMGHLLQAGHYSWQLGIPFQLWYTNRAEFAVGSGWEQKTIPAARDMLTDIVEFAEKKDKRSGKLITYAKKILQFRQGFELEWTKSKQLKYRPLMNDGSELPWTFTPITQKGIVDYYETVVKQKELKKLAQRPIALKADGSPGTYSPCDYCPLQATCDRLESSYESWVSAVQAHVTVK